MTLRIKENIVSAKHGRAFLDFTEIARLSEQTMSELAEELVECNKHGMEIAFAGISNPNKTKLNSWKPPAPCPMETHNPYLLSIRPLIEKLRYAGVTIKDEKESEFIDNQGNIHPVLLIANTSFKKFTQTTIQEITKEPTSSSAVVIAILQREFQYLLARYNQEVAMVDRNNKDKFSEALIEDFTRLHRAILQIPNVDDSQCLETLADTYWRLGMMRSVNDDTHSTALIYLRFSISKYEILTGKVDVETAKKCGQYIDDIEDDIRVVLEEFEKPTDVKLDSEPRASDSNNSNFAKEDNKSNDPVSTWNVKTEPSIPNSPFGGPQKQARSPCAQKIHTQVYAVIIGNKPATVTDKLLIDFICEEINPSVLTEKSVNGFSILDDIVHIGGESIRIRGLDPTIINTLLDNVIGRLKSQEQKRVLIFNVNNGGFTLLHQAAMTGNAQIFQKIISFYEETIGPVETFRLMAKTNDSGKNPLHYAQAGFNISHVSSILWSIKELYRKTNDIKTLMQIFEQRTVVNGFQGFLPASFNHRYADSCNLSGTQKQEFRNTLRDAWLWFKSEKYRVVSTNNNNNDRYNDRSRNYNRSDSGDRDRDRDRDASSATFPAIFDRKNDSQDNNDNAVRSRRGFGFK